MRSIYSGISGLKNMQTGMDIIGNNIANVNTTGFKASRISFQDILSQTVQSASAATGNVGGTNPMQVGMGMAVASIDTIFTDGTPQPTGKGTDLAIQGSGFFILSDGTNQMYTRAGGFDFDTQGNYVLPGTGYKVMGWQADSNGVINATGQVQNLVSPVGKAMPAQVSTQITYGDNLSADAAIGSTAQASHDVYDSLGVAHKVTTDYYKVDNNTWLSKISVSDPTVATGTAANDFQEIKFNSDGTFLSAQQATPTNKIDLNISGLDDTMTPAAVQTKTWTANINGSVNAFSLVTTATGAGKWNYTLSDSVDGVAVTPAVSGTVTWDATAKTYATALTTPGTLLNGFSINDQTISGTAPAASLFNVNAEVATDVTLTSFQMDNTAGSSHTQNFTTVVNGVPQTYAMTITKSTTTTAGSTNSWNYTMTQVGLSGATPVTGTIDEIADVPATGTTPDVPAHYSGFPTTIGGALTTLPTAYTASTAGGFNALQSIGYTTGSLSSYNVQFTGGANAMTLSLDSTGLSQFSGTSTVQATDQNGYAAGTLSTTAIDSNGILVGTFTNGQTQNLAQVALAIFNNPGGLTRSGSNMFIQSNNSGTAQVGAADSGGRGTFSPGNLEGSNVDLAQQFSDMIITERAYQANSKIITTSDEMLQDLNNLKR